MSRISIREVEKALKDPKFKKTLPPELDAVIIKYEQNPSCPCNIPIYNKVLKYASKQLREYFPGKEVVKPDEELLKIAENHWFVINCHVDELEKKLKEIEERPIIETDSSHEPTEIPVERGKIAIGPPTLTRFEKARITGARALQLSLGAPPFIPIPETAKTSLDIAIKELEGRVIPIAIRRVLPNGDYQNIPIDYFK